jgi:peptidoglycan hydrolase-like protein with peptidoglycan-binding domain
VVAITNPFERKPAATSPDSGAPTATATVTRGPFTSETGVSGTLGYAGTYHVVNQATGRITWLPSVGSVVRQGKPLYKVAGSSVVLLYGKVPLYRALSTGKTGADVKELNAALVALGYTSDYYVSRTSSYFGSATAYALKKFQKHFGMTQTGKLAPSAVVFVPYSEVRIVSRSGQLGAVAPGGSVMEVSSTIRQVTVALSADLQSQVKVGDKVNITLPLGETTPGVVSSVGNVATQPSSGGTATVSVKIRPLKSKATGQLDKAPVQVSIVTASVKDALSVPINALLALAGGGYAVEVVEADGRRHLVGVTVGLFDDNAGTVQVTGTGLQAGQKVVIPAT